MSRCQGEAARIETEHVWEWLDAIPDPEMPFVSIVDLGIVRNVQWAGERLHVVVTPTYSGCPALQSIEREIRQALQARGVASLCLEVRLAPPWTSDWLSAAGRAKLLNAGIVPPAPAAPSWQKLRFVPAASEQIACPRCGSRSTSAQGAAGGTACKVLYRCSDCRNPFEYFKSF